MTTARKPTGKLDAAAMAVVNGPEGGPRGLRPGGLGRGRAGSTTAAAADLHGVAERGPEEGPQFEDVDAPVPVQRASERAAGHGDQRWPHDGGHRPQGR